MRILLVSHLFPPAHSAGVEVFTSELAQGLAAIGHEVCVLHTEKQVGRRDLQLERRRFGDLPVFTIINNLFHAEFEQTWKNTRVEELFTEAVVEFGPDVVHFHHLMYLSAGCFGIAKQYARAVLFTPHDFYLECASMGQLVHVDGTVCHTVDTERCGTCIPRTAWKQGDWQRRVGRMLGVWHTALGLDLGPLARRMAGPPRPAVQRGTVEAVPVDVAQDFATLAEDRRGALLAEARLHVDRFLCPSDFLAQRMIRFGLPKERTFLCPTGVDMRYFQNEEGQNKEGADKRPASETAWRKDAGPGPVRIAFIGTMIPIKGPHLLLDAWESLPEELRRRGELALCGPLNHAPAYVESLRDRAGDLLVEVTGRLSREEVAARLRQTDLFVMPSMWFENRPLILHEALALGVPCLVSAEGGMAELIQPDRDGWHFPMGDKQALADRLAQVLADPSVLQSLAPESPDLCSWVEAAERFAAHYEEVLRGAGVQA